MHQKTSHLWHEYCQIYLFKQNVINQQYSNVNSVTNRILDFKNQENRYPQYHRTESTSCTVIKE